MFDWFTNKNKLGNSGLLIHRWNGLENAFPTVYYMPPKF
jgi:hypothetical protein